VALALFAAGLALAASLSSCARAGGSVASPREGGLIAAESFLADIAQNVAGSALRISSLVPPDTDPHEYQPRPADLATLARARILIVNGRGYESWLAPAMEALEGLPLVVASEGIAMPPDGSAGDPHLWMDPREVIVYVETIRRALTALYPDRAADFAANAASYSDRLRELDTRVRALLSPLPEARRRLLTNHDALGHFAAAYGFRIVGTVIPGSSTEAAPSARGLAALLGSIKGSGATVVFLDVGENTGIAREIAAEAGIEVVTDLYVEGLSGPGGPAPTYIDMIEHDAKVVADALE